MQGIVVSLFMIIKRKNRKRGDLDEEKEFLKLLLLFAIFFMISFCYGVFFLPLNGDEIWNYGFSYNIAKGLVIYRDFNVMVTPLYFFLVVFLSIYLEII